MSLAPGTRLGPYEVLDALGAGGMGEVYKARDTRLDRLVAVKILAPSLAVSSDARERFEREARTISRLSHPHVCALFDVGREGDTLYLVMELLEGESLRERLAKGPLTIPEVLRIGGEIAGALAAAAREGITHRDLKPGNVMVTRSGVKLLDFGLAKALAPASGTAGAVELPTAADLTAPGMWLGTAPYMAPEQIDGRVIDARSDVFALGAVLYEMATGRRAFAGDTTAGIASSILRVDPPAPSSIRPEVPVLFDRLVRECLAKDPDRRWQSAHDVALQLAAIGEPIDRSETRAVAPRRSRTLLVWAGSIAATALVVAAATTRIGRPDAAPPARLELEISPPATTAFTYNAESVQFAVSPDGQRLAFITTGPGSTRVWLRSLSSLKADPLPHRGSTRRVLVARCAFDRLRDRRYAEAPGRGLGGARHDLQGPEPDWPSGHVEPTRRDPVCNKRGQRALSRASRWRRRHGVCEARSGARRGSRHVSMVPARWQSLSLCAPPQRWPHLPHDR